MGFSENLQILRKMKNMSQEQFSKIISRKCSINTIRNNSINFCFWYEISR